MLALALLIVLLFICLSFFLSTLGSLEYRGETQILILQQQAINFDPYTAAKSAEKIGQNFIHIIPTTGFLNVVEQRFPELSISATSGVERRRQWQKKIDVSLFPETSLMKIGVYDSDPEKTKQWAAAVARVLETQGSQFHGGGDLVTLTIVDEPVASSLPVRPNLIFRVLVGAGVGVLAAAWFLRTFAPATWKRVFPWRELLVEPVHTEALFKKAEASYHASLEGLSENEQAGEIEVVNPEPAMVPLSNAMPSEASDALAVVPPTLLSYLNFEQALDAPAQVLTALQSRQPSASAVLTMHDSVGVNQLSG